MQLSLLLSLFPQNCWMDYRHITQSSFSKHDSVDRKTGIVVAQTKYHLFPNCASCTQYQKPLPFFHPFFLRSIFPLPRYPSRRMDRIQNNHKEVCTRPLGWLIQENFNLQQRMFHDRQLSKLAKLPYCTIPFSSLSPLHRSPIPTPPRTLLEWPLELEPHTFF